MDRPGSQILCSIAIMCKTCCLPGHRFTTFRLCFFFFFPCAAESQLFSGCAADTVSTLPLSCSALAHQLSVWLAALGYFFIYFFFAPPPTPIPAHLLFARRSPPRLGLRVFPRQPLLIAARPVIASQDQSGMQHEPGGSAYHTCCRIKGHSQRSGIIGEGGLEWGVGG